MVGNLIKLEMRVQVVSWCGALQRYTDVEAREVGSFLSAVAASQGTTEVLSVSMYLLSGLWWLK